jgi:membrane protease YdiL (CAAX protease family)
MVRRSRAAALIAGIALFSAAMISRDALDPWLSNAAVAAAVIAASLVLLRRRLARLFALELRSAALAALLGFALVAATHAGYRIAASLFPDLGAAVEALYVDIRGAPPPAVTAALISGVVLAEELLWRGLAIDLLAGQMTTAATAAVAIALYAIPQIAGGSPVLVGAAIGLGTVLTAQRLRNGRLTEPCITHAIWSVSIFALAPLV